MWSNLLVNLLIIDLSVNRLMVSARNRLLTGHCSEENDPSLVLVIVQKTGIYGFIRHGSLINVT